MTPTQLENAARALCRLRGCEPDAMDGTGYRVVSHDPWKMEESAMANWRMLLPEVERFVQVGTAIAAAMEKAKRKAKE